MHEIGIWIARFQEEWRVGDQDARMPVGKIRAELDNGRSFHLRLVVTSFLGISSAPFTARISRSAMPVPKISVQAPPLMEFPRSATVTLEASASIAAFCPSS